MKKAIARTDLAIRSKEVAAKVVFDESECGVAQAVTSLIYDAEQQLKELQRTLVGAANLYVFTVLRDYHSALPAHNFGDTDSVIISDLCKVVRGLYDPEYRTISEIILRHLSADGPIYEAHQSLLSIHAKAEALSRFIAELKRLREAVESRGNG